MGFRTKAVVVALSLALAGCVPPVGSNDIVREYAETTAMGLIQRRGVLRIGLEEDAFPLGADGMRPAGVTHEIGRELAESLGVKAEFVPAPAERLHRLVDGSRVDVAFPLVPITEAAVDVHALSDPWWVGHQRLLTVDNGVEDTEDLAGEKVCDAPEPVTGVPVRLLTPDVGRVIRRPNARRCAEALRRGRAAAASGPDVLLIPLLARLGEGAIVGDQHATAGYGALMSKESVGLRGFVDDVLREIDAEGRWSLWYREYVFPTTNAPEPSFPLMTLEEAAALYPK